MAESEVNRDVALKPQTYTIGGIFVQFPCQAYPSQIAIMDKIIRGIQRAQNCLLESPTGSGKTLALLCGVLAWRKHELNKRETQVSQETSNQKTTKGRVKAKSNGAQKETSGENDTSIETEDEFNLTQEQWDDIDRDIVLSSIGQKRRATTVYKFKQTEKKHSVVDGTESSTSTDFDESDSSRLNREMEENVTDNLKKTVSLARVPKIFFGTRTHKQIGQVVKELSKTEYKNVKMCILSSREHTCINSSKSIVDKNELCNTLLDPHNGPGCLFNSNVNRMGTHAALASLGLSETHDIEDLIRLGRRVRACPYYASRSLLMSADIVFCPYNYLIDPLVRETLNINLNGAVVVFDEAHNVEDISRSSASGEFSVAVISEAIRDCKSMVNINYITVEHQFLADFLTKLSDSIDQSSTQGTDGLWTGIELVARFELAGIGLSQFQTFKESFNLVLSDLKGSDMESNGTSKMTINTVTARIIRQLILVLNYLYTDNYREAYHGQLSRQLNKVDSRLATLEGTWLTARSSDSKLKWNYILKISCLDPSIVFKEMKMSRSVILSSGTLSPMDTFESELGVQFLHKLEANHVIHPSQVFVSTVHCGPTNISLNGKYANAMTFAFQEELGRLIIEVCKTVPHGVLCFLPSYTLMDRLIERWSSVGITSEIEKHKFVFLEPRQNSRMNDTMSDYYDGISATRDAALETEDGGRRRVTGCLLIGVCRGKISEGIDFSDNDARAVITVGIPFPNITDEQIIRKKEYNSKHAAARGLLTGDSWYQSQAFRALNQALGRCIRHRNDWGAIILVDERFGSQSNTRGLSKWIRQQVQSYSSWNSFDFALKSFIKSRKQLENT